MRLILGLSFCALLALIYASGLLRHFSLTELRENLSWLKAESSSHPWQSGGLFFLVYIAVTGLSLPGAAVMTLAGGALFGFWRALALVSFASTIGATFAFLVTRFLLRGWMEARFGSRFRRFSEAFSREGISYLVFLRLVPVFPFFLVNIFSGLTRISLWKFYLASQLAMLPGTALFVNAGAQLSKVKQLSDILSPALLTAFALIGIFPVATRKLFALRRNRDAARV
jgi:uncharacterized membrane protein YdjX (TVP38/TMEM64 family)